MQLIIKQNEYSTIHKDLAPAFEKMLVVVYERMVKSSSNSEGGMVDLRRFSEHALVENFMIQNINWKRNEEEKVRTTPTFMEYNAALEIMNADSPEYIHGFFEDAARFLTSNRFTVKRGNRWLIKPQAEVW